MELRRSCEMIFVRDGKVLLSKRGTIKHGAGTWALPGGHVKAGETAAEAVIRETREELGETLSNITTDLLRSGTFTVAVVDDRRPDAAPPVQYLHTTFMIEVPLNAEADNLEPDACAELRWFPKKKLPLDSFYPPHVAAIRNYIEGRSYISVDGLQ